MSESASMSAPGSGLRLPLVLTSSAVDDSEPAVVSPIPTPLPHSSSHPAFSETLGPSLSPKSSPSSLRPAAGSVIDVALHSGTALLSRVGRSFLQELAHTHRPFLWLHSAEDCFPCSIEWYLSHSDLYHGDTLIAQAEELSRQNIGDEQWMEKKRLQAVMNAQQHAAASAPVSFTSPSGAPALSTSRRGRAGQPRASKAVRHNKYNLRLRAAFRGGMQPSSLSSSMPVYCYVRESERHYDLLYIFSYAYNGPYRLFGLHDVGAHDGDFEHLTVRVSRRSLQVVAVYFAAHGWRDGQWRRSGQYETTDGRVTVYVARRSHATYPAAGTWLRIWGAASDRCDRGVAWDPAQTLLLHWGDGSEAGGGRAGVEWLGYAGWWEFEGINSVHQQQWWYEEPSTSNSAIRRLFFSFMPDCLGMKPELWWLRPEKLDGDDDEQTPGDSRASKERQSNDKLS